MQDVTLDEGRMAFATNAWAQAFALLTEADQPGALSPEDLELLAVSAYMLGRDDDYVDALERAHHALLDAGEVRRAVRCTFWIGHSRLFRGDGAQAMGWFDRGRRLLGDDECVEQGWLLIPRWLQQMGSGDWSAGHDTARAGAEIAERYGDSDLLFLALDEQGRALVNQGRTAEGLRLVDEVLVAAVSGELSPRVTGIVFCNTIAFCQDVFALPHAKEWTRALTRWCDAQPEMVAHNGLCLVHRAEIDQLGGAWEDSLAQAQTCATRFTAGVLNQIACGKAHYRQGEVHRLRGDHRLAERAYQEAHRHGYDPQPGLGLLRLAEGDAQAASAGLRRAVTERARPLERAGLLAAFAEVMVAVGELDSADSACHELSEVAHACGSEWLAAQAAQSRGLLALERGEHSGALLQLREALREWLALAAPYDAARTRVLLSRACQALGDADTARLELLAATAELERLGARSDLAMLRPDAHDDHGLTARELEVLRQVKAGASNRDIAASLTISEHTVARHLQNIFSKLGVTTRTAAGAYAFEHDLG
jgi:DNA-binding CsgD family transcriptional regulator